MKNLIFISFTVLCFCFCLSSCGDDAMDDPEMIDLTIIPGQGIGSLKMGDLGSKVESELGNGFERIINAGSSGNATYSYFNDAMGIDIIFGQQSSGDLDINTLPIKAFALFDGFEGMTEKGIKIGSTKAEVIAAYGEPDEMDSWFNTYYIGMYIFYNEMDKVRHITIFEI